MKKIYLVRHGQTVSNTGEKHLPNLEGYLTDLGKTQAQSGADWLIDTLPSIDGIYVSKFIRTQQTAEPLLEKTGMEPVVIDNLHEFDYLCLDTMQALPKHKRNAEADGFWQQYEPNTTHGEQTESFNQFSERVRQVLDEEFSKLPTGNHVIYTHGLWISMLIWQLLGQPLGTQLALRKFRQFELSIRAKNSEVFCLTLPDVMSGAKSNETYPPSITKARTCHDAPLDAHLVKD